MPAHARRDARPSARCSEPISWIVGVFRKREQHTGSGIGTGGIARVFHMAASTAVGKSVSSSVVE